MPTPLTIDDAVAAAFSDKLLAVALADPDIDILNLYAGFLLSSLSVAGMVLTIATAPENLEHNRATLVALMDHTLTVLKGMNDPELERIKAHFTAAGVVH